MAPLPAHFPAVTLSARAAWAESVRCEDTLDCFFLAGLELCVCRSAWKS